MFRENKGFTLVELMAAIVIIGILAAVAVPTYSKYIKRAKMAEAYQGLDNMSKKQMSYYLTTKEFHMYISYGIASDLDTTLYKDGYYYLPNSFITQDILPFPPTSRVSFVYQAAAGKNNGAGNPVAHGSDGYDFYTPGTVLTPWGAHGGFCTNHYTVGANAGSKPHYTWLDLMVSNDMDKNNSVCTIISKTIDTDSTGKLRTSAIVSSELGK